MTDQKTKLDPMPVSAPSAPDVDTSQTEVKQVKGVIVTKLPDGSTLTNYVGGYAR